MEDKIFKSIPEVHDSHDVHVVNEREGSWSLILKTVTTICWVAITIAAVTVMFEMINYFSSKPVWVMNECPNYGTVRMEGRK